MPQHGGAAHAPPQLQQFADVTMSPLTSEDEKGAASPGADTTAVAVAAPASAPEAAVPTRSNGHHAALPACAIEEEPLTPPESPLTATPPSPAPLPPPERPEKVSRWSKPHAPAPPPPPPPDGAEVDAAPPPPPAARPQHAARAQVPQHEQALHALVSTGHLALVVNLEGTLIDIVKPSSVSRWAPDMQKLLHTAAALQDAANASLIQLPQSRLWIKLRPGWYSCMHRLSCFYTLWLVRPLQSTAPVCSPR